MANLMPKTCIFSGFQRFDYFWVSYIGAPQYEQVMQINRFLADFHVAALNLSEDFIYPNFP